MFSFIGETALDPFLGSGTTSKIAAELGRNSIGYEINRDYLKTIKDKIGIDKKSLFKNSDFEIVYQKNNNRELNFKTNNNNSGIVNSNKINFRINDPNAWRQPF